MLRRLFGFGIKYQVSIYLLKYYICRGFIVRVQLDTGLSAYKGSEPVGAYVPHVVWRLEAIFIAAHGFGNGRQRCL